MAETTYKPGTPIWVDLGSKDPDGAKTFYTQLFGWEAEDLGPETGHYNFLRKDGKIVAALGGLMSDQQPTAWSTYLYTKDASATAEAVKAAGGKVLVEPYAVMDQGRMAVFADPTGGAVAVWEPAKMFGAELFNAPGSLVWNELNSRDLAAAKAFYPKAFGFDPKSMDMPGAGEYVQWELDGRAVAGALAMAEMVPAEVPSFWLVYFGVTDIDATMAKVTELGGTVSMGKTPSPFGEFSVCMDPQGAPFAAIQLNP